VLTVDYGDCLYAAIPWNNVAGDRKILIGWMVPGIQGTYPWKGQMSIPRDLSLVETTRGIRLSQKPASVIENSLSKLSGNRVTQMKNVKIIKELSIGQKTVQGSAYWLDAELVCEPGTTAGFRIAEKKGKANISLPEVEIGYDAAKHQLYFDRSGSGTEKIKKENLRQTIDLQGQTNKVRLVILFDKSSVEVFVNNGEKVWTTYIYPNADANGLSAFSIGGNALIKSLTIWDLSQQENN
jgi:fructan beta-fructosidase